MFDYVFLLILVVVATLVLITENPSKGDINHCLQYEKTEALQCVESFYDEQR